MCQLNPELTDSARLTGQQVSGIFPPLSSRAGTTRCTLPCSAQMCMLGIGSQVFMIVQQALCPRPISSSVQYRTSHIVGQVADGEYLQG